MEEITIWNKPTCATCRDAMGLLKKEKIKVCDFHYLEEKISRKELKRVLKLLGIKAFDLIRQKEHLFKEKYLALSVSNKPPTNEEWIDILIQNPILIERPIIIKGNKAVIGRPPEKMFEIIK